MSSVSPSLAALACALCLVGTAPAEPAPGCQPEAAQVLAQLNALRAAPRSCGSRVMAAVAPLGWEERLAGSARLYAQELAQRDTLTHQGQVLRSLRERLRAAGYVFRAAGENLAAGPQDLEEALQQWLASPEHCENLMLADFRDAGLACVPATGRFERYWVLHLGRSLPSP